MQQKTKRRTQAINGRFDDNLLEKQSIIVLEDQTITRTVHSMAMIVSDIRWLRKRGIKRLSIA